jgi:hypothetical protein
MSGRALRDGVAAAALAASTLCAAQNAGDLSVQAQYPAPVNTIEVSAGHKYDYRHGAPNESYRRIAYKGALLSSQGTPFKQASGLDLTLPAPTTGGGDRNDWSFRYEEGSAQAGGGLFEAMGVRPFSVSGMDKLKLRGTALVAGDADGKTTQLAAGLETAPWRLPGFARSQASNWMVFGLNAQRQEANDSPEGDKNFGVLTYRMFLGKAYGWRKSADVARTAARITQEFLRQAPDYRRAQELAKKIQAIDPAQRTALQQLFLDMVTQAENQKNWEKTVAAMAYGNTDAVTDQPTVAVYAENSGWYAFGRPYEGSRARNLFTLTLDYWFLPSREDLFLRARYETGYERATPAERRNHLLLSVGLKF